MQFNVYITFYLQKSAFSYSKLTKNIIKKILGALGNILIVMTDF